jgi:hypothetical protein
MIYCSQGEVLRHYGLSGEVRHLNWLVVYRGRDTRRLKSRSVSICFLSLKFEHIILRLIYNFKLHTW